MVACSWLLIMALRGAATGAGSLDNGLLVVLITGFSGSGAACFGLGLGLRLGELAGFHIYGYILSFWLWLQRAASPSPSALEEILRSDCSHFLLARESPNFHCLPMLSK